jgi:hypothetical protein
MNAGCARLARSMQSMVHPFFLLTCETCHTFFAIVHFSIEIEIGVFQLCFFYHFQYCASSSAIAKLIRAHRSGVEVQ